MKVHLAASALAAPGCRQEAVFPSVLRCEEPEAAEGEGVRPGVQGGPGLPGEGGQAGGGAGQGGQVGVTRLQVRELPPPETQKFIYIVLILKGINIY